MGQCHGTTKAGDRCKRTASADSLYCSAHAEQDPGFEAGPEAPDLEIEGGHGKECEPVDALLVAAALGAAAIVVVAVGKLFRL